MFLLSSCNPQKESVVGNGMHNLTAKYNYLYHSNLIVNTYEAEQRDGYATNFDDILSVYITADSLQTQDEQLDKVIEKAKKVIAEKSNTKYMADAYLLLAKAHFLKGNYYLSQAYYEYVVNAFPQNLSSQVQGLNGQARSLLQLGKFKLAIPVLNTLSLHLSSLKRNKAEVLATFAQANIHRQDYPTAINYLEASVKEGGTKQNQLRRIYILAQLEERQQNYQKALSHYLKVQKSYAPFDLYFHSNLHRIKIEGLQQQGTDKKQELHALIKEDKNSAFKDKLFYELAETQVEEKNYQAALENYQFAIKANTTNHFQKGLIYRQLATLNAIHFKNYKQASIYYDSSLNTLPKTFPGYEQLTRQHKNMQYLASRYEIISLQDSLQDIARLPEEERQQKIRSLFSSAPVVSQQQAEYFPLANLAANDQENIGSFYFDNPAAISRGISDFKKRWGDRKLEDNWRQRIRSSENTVDQTLQTGLLDPDATTTPLKDQLAEIQAFEATLPLTPTLMAASNHKIMKAYQELGNFYAQEMNDAEEAQKAFQILTERYPNSSYAQTQLNPEWRRNQVENERQQHQRYNEVYQAYEGKNYQQVINSVNQLSSSPEASNTVTAQLLYLQALAIGRTAPLANLLSAFTTIIQKFPNDPLITPLIQAQQKYLQNNRTAFQKRKVALVDTDQDEPPVISELVVKKEHKVPLAINELKPIVINPPKDSPGIFTKTAAATYYFVVRVADASITLSSSRFGIGQFNRGNYPDYGLKHQLTEIDNEQLIYIGNFTNFADVETYAEGIRPQLKQIMKVKESDYTSFIISQENFDKITSEDLLNKYLEFYKNNY